MKILYTLLLINTLVVNTQDINDYLRQGQPPTKVCDQVNLDLPETKAQLPIFSNMVVFGDSYSDDGNIYKRTFGFEPQNKYYCNGRYTNGEVWVEYLEKLLNKYYNHNKLKVKNLAYGGATSNNELTSVSIFRPSVYSQVNNMFKEYYNSELKANNKMNSTLVILWLAGNDYLDAKIKPQQVVNELNKSIDLLINTYNTKYLMILFMSPINSLPSNALLKNDTLNAEKNENWKLHNKLLETSLNKYSNKATIIPYHTSKVWIPLLSHAPNNQLGWNSTYPCLLPPFEDGKVGELGNNSYSCRNPNNRFFWDTAHPSTQVHSQLGLGAFEALLDVFKK